MPEDDDRRQYSRFTIPVVIDAPALSDLSLVPEDVSAGGLQVIVSKKREVGEVVPCGIQIMDENFRNCRSRIVRVTENSGSPGSWSIGFCVDSAEAGIDRFEAKPQALSVLLKKS